LALFKNADIISLPKFKKKTKIATHTENYGAGLE
jgi:hypothetical protein